MSGPQPMSRYDVSRLTNTTDIQAIAKVVGNEKYFSSSMKSLVSPGTGSVFFFGDSEYKEGKDGDINDVAIYSLTPEGFEDAANESLEEGGDYIKSLKTKKDERLKELKKVSRLDTLKGDKLTPLHRFPADRIFCTRAV